MGGLGARVIYYWSCVMCVIAVFSIKFPKVFLGYHRCSEGYSKLVPKLDQASKFSTRETAVIVANTQKYEIHEIQYP